MKLASHTTGTYSIWTLTACFAPLHFTSILRRILPTFFLCRFRSCLWLHLTFQTSYLRWMCYAFGHESSMKCALKHKFSFYLLMGLKCFGYIPSNNSNLLDLLSWSTQTQIFLREKRKGWRYLVILWFSNWRWNSHLPFCLRSPPHTFALGWTDLLPLLPLTLFYWFTDLSHLDFEKWRSLSFPGFYHSHPLLSPSWTLSYWVYSPSRYSLACHLPGIPHSSHFCDIHVLLCRHLHAI